MPISKRLEIRHTSDFSIDHLDAASWDPADDVAITRYWSGKDAPLGREFSARLLWSNAAVYIRFDASQAEPLVVSDQPDIRQKTDGLWNRDVCEIFIAPDRNDPNRYFEFEIAPTGEWLDLEIEMTPNGRKPNVDYESGLISAARIDDGRVLMAMRIPWEAFGRTPKFGDVWLGNLFRCVGKDPDRVYLAWQPTGTAEPNFHVPEAFGEFIFIN